VVVVVVVDIGVL
jgi:hypothetical protein